MGSGDVISTGFRLDSSAKTPKWTKLKKEEGGED
jgi:hypothetical protein